jgi:hypothetical protein
LQHATLQVACYPCIKPAPSARHDVNVEGLHRWHPGHSDRVQQRPERDSSLRSE